MMAQPIQPVLVLSGWRACPVLPRALAKRIASRIDELREEKYPSRLGDGGDTLSPKGRVGQTAGNARFDFIPIAFQDLGTIEACVERMVGIVRARGLAEAELEIVAVSMGGLVARKAILDGHDGVRIRARRVFTLATPHLGARLARWIRLDGAAASMRPGCAWLADLDQREAEAWGVDARGVVRRPYEMVCYGRKGDLWVGSANTAPAGMEAVRVGWRAHQMSHLMITMDERIVGDIARRLVETR